MKLSYLYKKQIGFEIYYYSSLYEREDLAYPMFFPWTARYVFGRVSYKNKIIRSQLPLENQFVSGILSTS